MAAIHDPEEEVDLSKLAAGVKSQLPTFAWPLFVRLVKQLDITGKPFLSGIVMNSCHRLFSVGTFKLRKFNLQREGFDPSIISDKLFFLHPKTGTYEALSVELFNSIISGAIRL